MQRILANRMFQRVGGMLLTGVGVGIAVYWFFWLLPLVRRYDPDWWGKFTYQAYWNAVQEHIHRHGWTHGDGYEVGRYGDKAWAQWIINRAEKGEEIDGCGNIGHKDEALNYITCHDPKHGVTNSTSRKQWLAWWSTNKEKSQLEWIQTGLAQYKVSVHIPPNNGDHVALLALLGNMSTNQAEQVPLFVKYNAFRWLRDSGFDLLSFALSNVTAQTPAPVRDGLFEYEKQYRMNPKKQNTGILPLAPSQPDAFRNYRPAFYDPWFQATGYSLMVIPTLAGAALLIRSFRCPRQFGGKPAP